MERTSSAEPNRSPVRARAIDLHADSSVALQVDAKGPRACHHLEVRPFHRRAQEGVGGAPAAAVALVDLEHRHAVLLGTVVVVASSDARRLARGDQPAVDLGARGALVRHS